MMFTVKYKNNTRITSLLNHKALYYCALGLHRIVVSNGALCSHNLLFADNRVVCNYTHRCDPYCFEFY